jgi:hypothetical protein
MAMDLRGLRDLLLASGEVTAEELDTMVGDGHVELIYDVDTFYVKLPFLASELGVQTPWVSAQVPEGGLGELAPLDGFGGFGALGGALGGAGSPTDYLAQLQSIDPSVRATGTEAVRGVQTTRYAGTLDARRLLAAELPPEEAAQMQAMLPFLEAFRLPYEVWIDAAGLPRRMSTTLDFGGFVPPSAATPTPGTPAPGMVFTYELFDFGSAVNIDLPAPSQVTAVDPATLRQ